MKPIKIVRENAAKIQSLLADANGRATSHAYTTYSEVEAVALYSEIKLDKAGLPKKQRTGVLASSTSGGVVTNAYSKKSSTRAATKLVLERRATCWYLIDVQRTEVYQKGGGPVRVVMSPEQIHTCVTAFELAITSSL